MPTASRLTIKQVTDGLRAYGWRLDNNQAYLYRFIDVLGGSVRFKERKRTDTKSVRIEVTYYVGTEGRRWSWATFKDVKEAVTFANTIAQGAVDAFAKELGDFAFYGTTVG